MNKRTKKEAEDASPTPSLYKTSYPLLVLTDHDRSLRGSSKPVYAPRRRAFKR